MPNQPDPNQNQPNNPPVINPTMDLPPLPQDTVTTPQTNTGPTAPQTATPPSSGGPPSGAPTPPPQSPSVIATKPKKKFGGGKIIATILGVLLLVGGIGAGIYLTQQQQLFQQKAYTSGVKKDTCNTIEVTSQDTGCPSLPDQTGTNNVTNYVTHYTIKNITDQQHIVKIRKHSNYCTEPYGYSVPGASILVCESNPINEDTTITLEAGASTDFTIERASPSGMSCGSYQTDLGIISVDGDTSCNGGVGDPYDVTGLISFGVCQTGTECTTATPTPNPTASCLNVKAYDVSWNALNTTDLAGLATDDVVNFCVAGNASSGSFDKAQFEIGSTLEAVTTTRGQGDAANDYCQSYTIKDTDTTVNVKAKIHHLELDQWVGETF